MTVTKSLSTALIDGTGAITPANVTVSTNTMTVGTAMYVVANGNVGVGLSNPSAKLDIYSNINNLSSNLNVIDAATARIWNANVGGIGVSTKLNFGVAGIGSSVISGYYAAFNGSNDIGTGLIFGTQTNTAGGTVERMRINNSGNVGIGNSSPSERLVVQSTGGQIGTFYNPSSNVNSWVGISTATGSSTYGVDTDNNAYTYTGPGSGIKFFTGGANERMRIASDGSIGLAVVPSSLYKVMIAGESRGFQIQASTNQTISRYDDNSLACSLKLRNLAMTANAHGIGVFFELSRDGANAYNAGYIASISEDIYSSTASTQDSSLVFATTQNGGTTQRMTLDSVGRVTVPQQPYCRVVSSAGNVTIVSGNQVVPYNSALSNIGSYFNTSTYRFTMPVTGKYLVTASIEVNGGSAQYYNLYVRVNGSGQFGTFQTGSGAAYQQFSTNGVVYGNATDYIDVALFAVSGSGTLECSGDTRCSLSITLLS